MSKLINFLSLAYPHLGPFSKSSLQKEKISDLEKKIIFDSLNEEKQNIVIYNEINRIIENSDDYKNNLKELKEYEGIEVKYPNLCFKTLSQLSDDGIQTLYIEIGKLDRREFLSILYWYHENGDLSDKAIIEFFTKYAQEIQDNIRSKVSKQQFLIYQTRNQISKIEDTSNGMYKGVTMDIIKACGVYDRDVVDMIKLFFNKKYTNLKLKLEIFLLTNYLVISKIDGGDTVTLQEIESLKEALGSDPTLKEYLLEEELYEVLSVVG